MRLSCPGCGEQVLAQPPSLDRPPGRPVPPYCHTDATPLCPTPTPEGSGPHWPDDHDPHHITATIPANTLARPKVHPCRAHGGAVGAPIAAATVVDKQGGINCPATVAAGRCPYAAAGLLDRNEGGLQAAGCWLRVAAPHAAIATLHQAGVPLPHRVPGFAHHLGRTQIQALITWLRRHDDTYLESLPPHARPDAAAVWRQTLDWLGYAATTAGGLRTVWPNQLPTRRGDRQRGCSA